METVFMLLVAVLLLLAISDLVVGVSNDAVNFLNSAIGSKSAPFWIIMIIASAGIMIGATFSEGMMEVARSSIFRPKMFSFNDIMIIFLAVMLTDIILLDTFNTLGLPTSTTVSLVFELLGAALAMSIIKMNSLNNGTNVGEYINSGEALVIISGILMSVVIAFTFGTLIQFLLRIVFSFDYKNTYKYFGAIWGGFSIAAITYFMLIKGAKGASFMSDYAKDYIAHHTWTILVLCFIGWTIFLAILQFALKVNILKIIVLFGTFALAMAFAGNDLVNFIGVPIAGLKSFELWSASGVPSANFTMESLAAKVQTPTIFLLIAGIVMVITLWLSKKARTVTDTEVNLGKQGSEGYEKFESTPFSRFVVRQSIKLSRFVSFIVPEKLSTAVQKRFEPTSEHQEKGSAFDLIRASVNLTVSSILISFATSYKLPLSTTYVTFMVAMGSSLADGAWGRESAVYRVSGVAAVIGGWFLTAFIAFTSAVIMVILIHYTNFYAVPVILILGIYTIIKSNKVHKQREHKKSIAEEARVEEKKDMNIMERCSINITSTLSKVTELYDKTIHGIETEDRKKLKKVTKELSELSSKTKALKESVDGVIVELQEDSIDTGHHYVQVIDYLREISNSLSHISKPLFQHVDNQHIGFSKEQNKELSDINKQIKNMYSAILKAFEIMKFTEIEEQIKMQQDAIQLIEKSRKNQIKRIKHTEVGTKNSILFFNVLSESKNLCLFTINLLKSQRDFIVFQSNRKKTEKISN